MTKRRRRLALAAAAAALAGSAGVAAAQSGAGGPAGSEPTADTFTVALTAHHSRFTPSSVRVPAGSTVRFVVRNLDPIDHELIVGDDAVHQRHETGREAHHHGDVPGEITVPAGAIATTTWTAPATPQGIAFACHLPGHLDYGMAGVVTVTPRT